MRTWTRNPDRGLQIFATPPTKEATLNPLLIAATSCCLVLGGCGPYRDAEHRWPGTPSAQSSVPGEKIEVPPPPFSEGIFPCSDCHDPEIPVNTNRRKLEMAHQDIVLEHDAEHRWCLDCHSAQNRDKLHLASGELVDFTESYRLCGQCHGDKFRDWKAGVHGRRTGQWNGKKNYLLCVNCHNAHSPAFKLHYVPAFRPDGERSDRPMPPPPRPDSFGEGIRR
ncbi:MAG: hypothetical protein Fur0037_02010 [Planctomycetota bacterium]